MDRWEIWTRSKMYPSWTLRDILWSEGIEAARREGYRYKTDGYDVKIRRENMVTVSEEELP